MAVAIWDHAPTGEELLERRTQQGWTPRTTNTVDGEVVLGLGACLRKQSSRQDGGN